MSTWQFQFWTEVICEEHAGDEGPAEDSSSDVDEVHFGKKIWTLLHRQFLGRKLQNN